MSAGFLGMAAIWMALVFALVAVVWGKRRSLVLSAALALAATVVLAGALLALDFGLAYVSETTSAATPWPYRLAALWGGMEGSMLLYTGLGLSAAAAGLSGRVDVRVGAMVGLVLLLVVIGFANPFSALDLPAVDGAGLLAILQHPAMIYHPPLLYGGLVVLIVPFALTVGMVLTGGDRRIWMERSRRWLYASWALLTVGMAAGANWAYVELGWGGFWAWDPVENTALMPWLASTVLLHTSRLETAGGRLRRWNVFFTSFPFALSMLGIYLTRSGATGSIHSFAEDPVVGRVLLSAAVAVTIVAAVIAAKSPPGTPWGRVRLDRSGWLAIHAVVTTAGLVFVTAGSAYPAFLSVFGGQAVTVDSRFFTVTMLPVAVLVAAGLSLAHVVDWRLWLVLAVASGVAGVAAGGGWGVWLAAPAAASLVLLGVLLVRGSPRGRALAAQLAHLGMALILFAVAGSAFGGDFAGTMRPGDRVEVSGHDVFLEEVVIGEADRYEYARASFLVDGSPLQPEIRAYEDQDLPVAEPRLRTTPLDDVIVAVSLLFPDGETVEVSVFVRPLVWWLWVGAAIVGSAGLVALFSGAGGAGGRRRLARSELRSAGTTSGSDSR